MFNKLLYACSSLFVASHFFVFTARGENADNVDQIKAFLTNCPPIEIAIIKAANDLGKFDPRGVMGNRGKIVPPPKVAIYQGARDEDNFYVRQVFENADAGAPFDSNTLVAVGRSQDIVWNLTKTGSSLQSTSFLHFVITRNSLTDVENRDFRNDTPSNSIAPFSAAVERLFCHFIDLGLYDMKPGSFQFDGNSFRFELNKGNKKAEGNLILEGKKVSGLRYHIIGTDLDSTSNFKYSPNPDIPEYLPSRVVQTSYRSNNATMSTNMDYEFVRLEYAKGPIDRAYFLPDRFAKAPSNASAKIVYTQLIFSNQTLYANQDRKHLIAVPDRVPASRSGIVRTFTLCAFTAVLLAPLFVLIIKAAIKRKRSTQ